MEQNSLFASPGERRSALRHLMLTDHGFLRVLWTHEFEIAPGVWRSNQPSPKRIASWAARGIKSVILLRSSGPSSSIHRLEQEACRRYGLKMHYAPTGGSTLGVSDQYLKLLEEFKKADKPFVIHCKSGIDRTGLAAFLYLLAETDTPPEIARRQLSFRFLHLNSSRHGILDHMADAYLAAYRARAVPLREWVANDYDPEALTAQYKAGEAPG